MVFKPEATVYHRHDRSIGEYLRKNLNIGYWKTFIFDWLPEKALSDSHAPWTQQVHTGLIAVVFLSVIFGFFWTPAAIITTVSLLLFTITSIPFLMNVVSKDAELIFLVPLLLIVRASTLIAVLIAALFFPSVEQPDFVVRFSFPKWDVKRGLDILGSIVGLLVSAPILAIAAVAIKLETSGPVLFRQKRVGKNGQPFRIVKLRTMVVGAEEQANQAFSTNHLELTRFKTPTDPRVTRVGRYLRRWSLDEMPQLWNVLKGEMSLVGPRPEEALIVDQYDDKQRERLSVKPGITGEVQVSGRNDLDFHDRIDLDLDYINNYSLKNDLLILARTIPAVIMGVGAY